MNRRFRVVLSALAIALALPLAFADAPIEEPATAEAWVRAMTEAYYGAGRDMRAKVKLSLVHPTGPRRERELTLLRVDLEQPGEQRYFIHFSGPAEVRDTAFLVWRHAGANDDRWVFMPALNLVRRIAAEDSRSSFVGSDFTHEDVSGRDPEDDEHTLAGREELDGRACVLVDSTPRAATGHAKVRTWIDAENKLPLRMDFLDARDKVLRRLIVESVEDVPGADGASWPTATRRVMADLATGHKTEVVFEKIEYDLGLAADDFNEAALKRPPRRWLK